MAPSNRVRSNCHKLKHKKFHINRRKNFTFRVAEYWNRLPWVNVWRHSKPTWTCSYVTCTR